MSLAATVAVVTLGLIASIPATSASAATTVNTPLATNWLHSCAVTATLGVRCWGDNAYGQLGDGTTTDRSIPVDVSGLTSGVTAVATGAYHSCAVTSVGGAKCWGYNALGQVGDGTSANRSTPVDVSGLTSGVAALAGGYDHTCALTTAGGVKCWGDNAFGQLGNGTTKNSPIPVDVSGLTSDVAAIAAGYGDTCALTTGGAVKCWGVNDIGQLGDGTTTNRSTPVSVLGLSSGVMAIADSYAHTCALTSSGGAKCWGSNQSGQLGDGTTTNRSIPVDVSGLPSGVTAIATGFDHTCAVIAAAVMCWGDNAYGQLGNGTIDGAEPDALTPVQVFGLTSRTITISAGHSFSCASTLAGSVECWGANDKGELGEGTTTNRSVSVAVSGLTSGVTAVATGSDDSCALTSAGAVTCWGYNGFGELGDGTTMQRATPVSVVGATSGIAMIAAGFEHTCALTSTGGVTCWGNNSSGQLGDGTTSGPDTCFTIGDYCDATPVNVSGLASGITAITAGGAHTCALTSGGEVLCWGDDQLGQLGDGGTANRATPVGVSGLSAGVIEIAAGSNHTCALMSTSVVKCWGDNSYGQLGDGTSTGRLTPVQVTGLTGVTAITAGAGNHTCALTSAGQVSCWGSNVDGELGNGTNSGPLGCSPGGNFCDPTPVSVTGLASKVTAIAAGSHHTCALTSAGGVACWGNNADGELGNGTTTQSTTPVKVSGLTSGVVALASGFNHTCAATKTGAARCWGNDVSWQLGNDDLNGLPVTVVGSFFTPALVPSVVSSANPSAIGESVTFTATALSPTGTLRFYDGTTLLGSKATTTGSASLTTARLAVGAHAITATFTNRGTTTPFTSQVVTQQVDPAATSASLASSVNPSVLGKNVRFTVTVRRVAPAAGNVTGGTIMLFIDGTPLATKTAVHGKAAFATQLATVGAHSVTATFSGSSTDQASTAALTQQVT